MHLFRPHCFRSKVAAILILLAIVAVFGPGSAGSEKLDVENEPRRILIIYSGNTLGELKPCGCAKEEDQGGIERRMSYFNEVRGREKNTLIVDTGDNFKEPTRQGKIKADYLMQAVAGMQYDAVMPGDHDFVYGNSFIEAHGDIPWVLSNLESSLPISTLRIKQFDGGLKAAVIAVADPGLLYEGHHADSRITDPLEAVQSEIRKLSETEKPDLLVLMTHMTREKALRFLDVEGVDVVINGHIAKDTDVIDMKPVQNNGRIFVQPGPRGQKMGELLVTLDAGGKKAFAQKMVPLGSKIPLHPEMAALYEVYNKEVEDLFFASLAQKKNKKTTRFATEKVCKTCHPKAHGVWENSRHGKAYDTLRRVNKAFDPECLACHVTGLNEVGGFISEIDTPELMHVQCEVCHGPALNHSQAPAAGFGDDAKKACAKCHVKNHSPRFQFDTYWEKIKHSSIFN